MKNRSKKTTKKIKCVIQTTIEVGVVDDLDQIQYIQEVIEKGREYGSTEIITLEMTEEGQN